MNTVSRFGIVAVLTAWAVAASGDTQFLTLHRSGVPTDQIGPAGLPIADVTGDGIADIASCANGAPLVLSKRGAEYVPVWYGPNVGCTAITIGDRDADGKRELFVGTSSYNGSRGRIHVFNPTGAVKPLASVTLPTGGHEAISGIAVGDVDSDGHAEIVAVTENNGYVYSARTLLLEWDASGQGGRQVQIANIDDDGRTEIVINGGTGRVLDAWAQSLKWGYSGGFGTRMEVGNVDSDPESEIVSVNGGTVRILNGDDFSSTSFTTAESYYYGSVLALGDLSGDGKPEIIREITSAYLAGYDTAGTQLWSLYSPDSGASALAAGDVDGDGSDEIVWSTGLTHSGADQLHIANKSAIEASVADLDGYFSTAVADLDGDGNLELIVASHSTDSGYEGGKVQILDYRTKALEGTLTLQDAENYWGLDVWDLAVGQLDGDAALEILIVGAQPYDGRLVAFDGVTHAKQWSSSPYSPTYLARTVVVTNIDGDALDEIIIGMSDSSVHILNGASPIIQWTSANLGAAIHDVKVADVDEDGKTDIVVGTSNAVHVLTPATNGARKVTLTTPAVRVAATGGRFAVLDGNQWGGSGSYSTNVRSFKGSDLSQEFACPFSTQDPYLLYRALAFGPIGGQERLIVAQEGTLFILPLGGTSCPAMEQVVLGRDVIYRMHFAELTGDSHPELLIDAVSAWEILTVGTTAEPRGDTDRDGLVTDVDIDTLVRWLLADGEGIPPSADVNGDGCIDTSDVFYLINYRRGTGPAPVP